jgi:hypothetical protein
VVGPKDVLALATAMEHLPKGMRVPYPAYVFTNVAGELRRLRERIEALKKGPISFEPVEGEGWKLEARPELNRIALSFERRPDKGVTQNLRRYGWRWSPREGAWLRMLNPQGVTAAHLALERLFGWKGTIARRFEAAADDTATVPGEVLVPLIEAAPSIARAFPTAPLAPPRIAPPQIAREAEPRLAPEQLGLGWAPLRSAKSPRTAQAAVLGATSSGKPVPRVALELGALEKAASLAVHAHGLGSVEATPAVRAAQSALRAHFDAYASGFTADDHRDAATLLADHKWAQSEMDRHLRYAHNGLEQRHREAAERADKQAWEAAFRGEG